MKILLEKHKNLHTALLLIVLLGTCMVIGDGLLTPAMSGILHISYAHAFCISIVKCFSNKMCALLSSFHSSLRPRVVNV